MPPPILMLLAGLVLCANGVLVIRFRRRLTDWQNFMYREYGWNPRQRPQNISVRGMTTIGCCSLVMGGILLVVFTVRVLSA